MNRLRERRRWVVSFLRKRPFLTETVPSAQASPPWRESSSRRSRAGSAASRRPSRTSRRATPRRCAIYIKLLVKSRARARRTATTATARRRTARSRRPLKCCATRGHRTMPGVVASSILGPFGPSLTAMLPRRPRAPPAPEERRVAPRGHGAGRRRGRLESSDERRFSNRHRAARRAVRLFFCARNRNNAPVLSGRAGAGAGLRARPQTVGAC